MTHLDELLDVLLPRLKRRRDEDQALNGQHAFEFKVFGFFSPPENTLSRILSDLLNPRGCHGQGKVFLDRFLKCIDHLELAAASDRAAVRYQDTSYWAAGGGIPDITVDLDGYLICIENKPFAGDQPDQVKRYRLSMEKRRRKDFCLVYLSGRGAPNKHSRAGTPGARKSRPFSDHPIRDGSEPIVGGLPECFQGSEDPLVLGGVCRLCQIHVPGRRPHE